MDEAGNYYLRHVTAMTREQLHSKSDIAAELGHRDMEIDQLREQLQSALLSGATARQYAEQLESDVSTAIGTCAYMDPPDGGNVSLPEQVRRMRADRDALAAQVEALQ